MKQMNTALSGNLGDDVNMIYAWPWVLRKISLYSMYLSLLRQEPVNSANYLLKKSLFLIVYPFILQISIS